MRNIDAEWIKKVLGERRNLQAKIHKRILTMYDELYDTDERIRSATFPGADENNKIQAPKDLFMVLQREQNMYHQQEKEIRQILYRLTQELEAINRTWICYQILGSPAHEILKGLYVDNRLYHDVEEEIGLNHRIFEETREAAIETIIRLYQSSLSNVDIINLEISHGVKKRKSKRESQYQQMELNLVPESGTEQEGV